MLRKPWGSWSFSFFDGVGVCGSFNSFFSGLLLFGELSRGSGVCALACDAESALILELASLLTDIVIGRLGSVSYLAVVDVFFVDVFDEDIGLSVSVSALVGVFA